MRSDSWGRRFSHDDGVTAIEYGLIAAGVGLASVTALTLMGDGLSNAYMGAVDSPGLQVCATGATCNGAPTNPAFGVEPVTPGFGTPTGTAEPPAWPTAPPCQSVDLGTEKVARGGTFAGNVFTLADPDITGGPQISATVVAGDTLDGAGLPRWTVATNGAVTWRAPTAAGKKITFTLTYTSGTCSGSNAVTLKVQNNG